MNFLLRFLSTAAIFSFIKAAYLKLTLATNTKIDDKTVPAFNNFIDNIEKRKDRTTILLTLVEDVLKLLLKKDVVDEIMELINKKRWKKEFLG